MIVCSCNVFSDGEVRACLKSSLDCPHTPAQVYRDLGCGPQCGRCATTIRSILDERLAEKHACSADREAACPLNQQANLNLPAVQRKRWMPRSRFI
ncbi:(2Fe-2S)-binding protein [Microvirga lupini]|uniref:(2Fe-2S)-binding protein n=1 Tax=Microvirga lupini TaxID=420324 RepID=UPI001610564B